VFFIHSSLLFTYFFTSSQITQVQFPTEKHASSISLIRFNQQLKNGMTSWRMNIPLRLTSNPVLFTTLQEYVTVLSTVNNIFTQALDKNTWVFVFPYNKWFWLLFVLEKVIKLFIIDLQERTIDCKTQVWILIYFIRKLNKDFIYGLGNNTKLALVIQKVIICWVSIVSKTTHSVLITEIIIPMWPKHSVCLSRPSLTVCKYSGIETSDNISDAIYNIEYYH